MNRIAISTTRLGRGRFNAMILIAVATTVSVLATTPGLASAASYTSPVAVYTGPGLGGVNNVFCQAILFGINPLTGQAINFTAANPIIKTVTRSDNPNGSSDFEVVLAGDIPTSFSVSDGYDCLWIDLNGDGLFTPGESMRPYVAPGVTIVGASPNRSITFQVNVPGAVGKTVCDIGSGINYTLLTSLAGSNSGIQTGSWLYFYSQTVCSVGAPDPVIPEVPLVPLLAAVAGVVGVVAVRHRGINLAERS